MATEDGVALRVRHPVTVVVHVGRMLMLWMDQFWIVKKGIARCSQRIRKTPKESLRISKILTGITKILTGIPKNP